MIYNIINTYYDSVEHFENKLKKFKNVNKKKEKFGNIAKNKNKSEKFKNVKKATFEDAINRASNLDVSKTSFDYIKKEIAKYNKSLKSEKFENTGNATHDALEKYKFFKEKFYEIFK